MKVIENYIKKRWCRIGIFIIAIFTLFGAKNGCCPCEKPSDKTEILEVYNDRVYYSFDDDTLNVNFVYRIRSVDVDSFNYLKIYYYAISKWWRYVETPEFATFFCDEPIIDSAPFQSGTSTIILSLQVLPIRTVIIYGYAWRVG